MKSIEVAQWAAERGWAVVKIVPGTKKAAEKWRDLGFRSPEEVGYEWGDKEWAVGILTGPSRLVDDDLDVDDEGNPAGDWSLEELAYEANGTLPRTFTLATPSGGTHLVWAQPNGRDYKTCSGQVAPHIDVRGHGGLFVLWDPKRPRIITDDRDPVPMPKWLSELHPEPGAVVAQIAEIPSASAWLREYGDDDKVCAHMVAERDKWLRKFQAGESPHEVMKDAVYALIGDRIAGHLGLNLCLDWIKEQYFNSRNYRPGRDLEDDWYNSVATAIAKKVGASHEQISNEDPCYVEEMFLNFNPLSGRARGGVFIDDIDDRNPEWLCKPWFPFASLVIIDGDPGQGKSVVTNRIVANASSGVEILPSSNSCGRPIKCGLVISEDDDYIVKGRLRAAGYKFNRSVIVMNTKYKGKYLKFPDGIDRVRKFIIANSLELLIIDPISQYIGEQIQTHNESSVRDALGPLAEIAQDTGACIVLVRHLNKSGQMKAMYRGGGSIAFSALARSGLITGELPHGRFGIAQVKCSYARPFKGALPYIITEWDQDEEIPVVEWQGHEEGVSADDLVKGPSTKRGPEPSEQGAIRDVFEQLFETKNTWPQTEVMQQLKDAGCSTNHVTVDKVRAAMGIVSRPVRVKGSKFAGWEWTIEKATVRSDGDTDEEKGPFDD